MVKVFGVAVAAQDFGDNVRATLTGERDAGKTGNFTSLVHAFDVDSGRKDAFTIDLRANLAAILILGHEVKVSYVGCVKNAEKFQGISKVDFGGSLAAMTGGTDEQVLVFHNITPFLRKRKRTAQNRVVLAKSGMLKINW